MSGAEQAGTVKNAAAENAAVQIAPTRRLYEEDAYCSEFDAVCLGCEPVLNTDGNIGGSTDGNSGGNTDGNSVGSTDGDPDLGRYALILDRTAFFPEGGGQSADTGRIGGLEVTDVQIRPDGVILHIVTAPEGQSAEKLPVPGSSVSCAVNRQRRFGFMQCHTGEHILSGLMHRQYGFDNIGFHLSDHSVTLDVNGQLTDAQIETLEYDANAVVWADVPVTARFPSEEELGSLTYRSKREVEGPLRLVTVEGVDVCACCAPHVRRTGEIGSIRILRVLRYNGGMRLTIACGSRALRSTQLQQRQAEQVSHLTNSPQEDIAGGVSRVLSELEQTRGQARALQERIAQLCLEHAAPDSRGNIWIFEDSLPVIPLRNLVNSLCERGSAGGGRGFCGGFALAGEKGYTYIVGSYGGADAREVSRALADALSSRGGGKPAMVQGSVKADRSALQDLLAEI